MNMEQFQDLLDRHGADLGRWPREERTQAEHLVADNAEARAALTQARRLDAALSRLIDKQDADDAAVMRVVAKLNARPLPRQKVPLWRLPAVLLDLQFAPAWPRVAALCACAVLGFYIGISGLDRRIDRFDGSFAASSDADFGSLVFEPEPLTGERL